MAEGRVVWIVGGGSGIGAAVARIMAARGWTVAVSGRRREALEETAAGRTGIHPYPLDVTDAGAIGPATARIAAELGRIDMLIFAAAAWQPMAAGDYDFDSFAAIIDTNFLGAIRMIEPLKARMRLQGSGQIVLVASVAGYLGLPRAAAYGASKAAMIHVAEAMRVELAPDGIAVRIVCPGFVKSPLTERNDFPMPFLMETEAAARRIVDGLTRTNRFEIAFPWQMVWTLKTLAALPYPLRFAITRRLMPKRGANDPG